MGHSVLSTAFALLVFISKQSVGFKIGCSDISTVNHVSLIEIKDIFFKKDLAKRAAVVASKTENSKGNFYSFRTCSHGTSVTEEVFFFFF